MALTVNIASIANPNEVLDIIGRDVFEYEISKFLQPYERFLLSATCRWMNDIFRIENDNLFTLHSKSDLAVLKHDIIDQYFRKRKGYRQITNIVDLSNQTYAKLTRHERLCIKYALIFNEKLPEYFPQNSFQNFLDYALKLTFTSNDADYVDSMIIFLYDIMVHETSNISTLIHNLHLDNIGLTPYHLNILSNKVMIRTHNLRYLYLADNPLLNDECTSDLFLCIAANNHHLEVLDLSNTSITNKTCEIIYDFCQSVYKINNGRFSNYSSDNDSNWIHNIHDKESQSMDHMQEVIYMSSEEGPNDEDQDSDIDFSTDDEFDAIVERKLVNTAITYSLVTGFNDNNDEEKKDNDDKDNDGNLEDNDHKMELLGHLSETMIAVQASLEIIDESQHNEDRKIDDEEGEDEVVVTDDDLSMVSDPLKIALNLKWIDLKNNKGITSEGVDKLNQIYVKKIEPSRNFVLCVEGCSYNEPNPNWDLSLL